MSSQAKTQQHTVRRPNSGPCEPAIAKIDQRISDVDFGSFSIERRSGIPVQRLNSSVRDENRFGVVEVPQLKSLGAQTSSMARSAAGEFRLRRSDAANGWEADRMGFNDPFTPAQTRIDAEDVIAGQSNGDVLISARRNRLIVEERLHR